MEYIGIKILITGGPDLTGHFPLLNHNVQVSALLQTETAQQG